MIKRIVPFLIAFLLFELIFRIYFSVKVSDFSVFLSPQNIIRNYYPALKKQSKLKNEGQFNILMLGGSVISPNWSDFEKMLMDSLSKETTLTVNIDNYAQSSHTSLDSKIKYQLIEDKSYDAVLLYHGINELRFNLCSEEHFQEDYSHIAFYQKIYALKNWTSKLSIIPYSYVHFLEIIETNLYPYQKVTLGSPLIDSLDQNLLEYGTEIKTTSSLYKNYEFIIEQVLKTESDIIIPSFATHIPSDYSLEKFKKQELNYIDHTLPIELWGSVESISKGLKEHNKTIKKVASNHQSAKLTYIDLDSLLDNPEFYNDVCHLSTYGTEHFVSNIYPELKRLLKQKELSQYKP